MRPSRPWTGARRYAAHGDFAINAAMVLSVPYPLRFLFDSRPEVTGRVLGIVDRCIAAHLIKTAGLSHNAA